MAHEVDGWVEKGKRDDVYYSLRAQRAQGGRETATSHNHTCIIVGEPGSGPVRGVCMEMEVEGWVNGGDTCRKGMLERWCNRRS